MCPMISHVSRMMQVQPASHGRACCNHHGSSKPERRNFAADVVKLLVTLQEASSATNRNITISQAASLVSSKTSSGRDCRRIFEVGGSSAVGSSAITHQGSEPMYHTRKRTDYYAALANAVQSQRPDLLETIARAVSYSLGGSHHKREGK